MEDPDRIHPFNDEWRAQPDYPRWYLRFYAEVTLLPVRRQTRNAIMRRAARPGSPAVAAEFRSPDGHWRTLADWARYMVAQHAWRHGTPASAFQVIRNVGPQSALELTAALRDILEADDTP